MIIRILGQGQYEVPDDLVGELNTLDSDVEGAINVGDENAFGSAMAALIDFVIKNGTELDYDVIVPSDAVLPPDDATLGEARDLLKGDGLIPG